MSTPEKQFDDNAGLIRANPDTSYIHTNKCLAALRDMKANPNYQLGSMAPMLNQRISQLSNESGMSYESIIMNLSNPFRD